jgi:hypothetical protein
VATTTPSVGDVDALAAWARWDCTRRGEHIDGERHLLDGDEHVGGDVAVAHRLERRHRHVGAEARHGEGRRRGR